MPRNFARSLDWDDFRLINAIATARTLPAAALLLGLDHSTVFRRLRGIEARIGTPVFERGPGGYLPTAAGAELAELSARVDEDIATVMRRVAGQSPSPAGEVRIATSDALLFDLVLPLLAEFRAACPDVRLDLVIGNAAVNLSRRDADVAIRATAAPPDTLVGRKVGELAWAAYARADEAVAADPPWVGFGDALALAAAPLLRSRVAEHRIVCRFDTVSGVIAGVGAGLGHGFLPCFAGDRNPELVRLGAPLAGAATPLWLLTHPDLRNVPRVRLLMDFLGQRLASLRGVMAGDPLPPPG